MAQLSDDCFAHGGRLMRSDEALDLLGRTIVRVTESEPVALARGLGRILAEDPDGPLADEESRVQCRRSRRFRVLWWKRLGVVLGSAHGIHAP